MGNLWQDLRYAVRMLRKSPGFTAVAVITLALGIGANTAIFSVVQGVVLSPLPYFQPDRLVIVWETNPRFPRVWNSYLNFQDWQRGARSFEQMAAFREQGGDLTRPGKPAHFDSKQISSGFFSTLGAPLTLGREFTPEEDRRGGTPAAMISDRLWRSRFAASPEVLGTTVTVNGADCVIVGVAPAKFRLEGDTDVYTPLGAGEPTILNNRGSHDGIFTLARLKPGVTVAQGQAEMSTIQSGLDQMYPEANRDLGVFVQPLKQGVVGDIRGTLLLLLGAVGFVLLIACANVANLTLSRSAARAREFAIRAALGANQRRLVSQLLTESVLLSLIGAGVGSFLAVLAMRLVAVTSKSLPRNDAIAVNTPVLFFTLAISIVAGILFGLAPALKSWNPDLQSSLKKGQRGSTSGQRRTQSSFVVVQIALTMMLLSGAGLLFRTMHDLWKVKPGFDTDRILTLKVGVSRSRTKTPESTRIAYRQLAERVRQISGVEAAEFTNVVPLSGEGATMPFWINSRKPVSLQAAPRLSMTLTGPDYLKAMGVPLVRGRFFAPEDTTKSPCVMVIDSTFAQQYFAGGDPIGQTISAGFSPVGPCEIVGVVGHVKEWQLNESSTSQQSEAYFPLYQDPDEWVAENFPFTTMVVRTPLDAATIVPAVKAAAYEAGDEEPVYAVKTMRDVVADSMSAQRFPMILLGAFAGLALLLASVGIYGVLSYAVTQRVHEIGIRMALGAQKSNVFRMVVTYGLRLALAGVAIGILCGLILTRVLSSLSNLLYGVGASDPLTFGTVACGLVGVAFLACYIPARRAARVDPMVALRYE